MKHKFYIYFNALKAYYLDWSKECENNICNYSGCIAGAN